MIAHRFKVDRASIKKLGHIAAKVHLENTRANSVDNLGNEDKKHD